MYIAQGLVFYNVLKENMEKMVIVINVTVFVWLVMMKANSIALNVLIQPI